MNESNFKSLHLRQVPQARFEIVTIKRLTMFLLLALAGCSSTPSGSQSVGAKSVIDGVDVWKGGTPSRPYQVIDTVAQQGADNSATFADEERLLARDARARGADGLIVLNSVMVPTRMDVTTNRPVMAPRVNAELIKYQ
jgi:hypothetical protein